MLVANARMYSATPAAKQAWKAVLGWVLARAGLAWEIIDYGAPAPLAELWAREDFGCVMMCGIPYTQRSPRPTVVVAPVPSPERYGGRPIYFTDIVVRADSPYRSISDTFGGVVGYTLEDSMSGCVALRDHLLPYRTSGNQRLFRESIGGLVNARQVIEALDSGQIDVGPVDSYYFDLLQKNAPNFASKVRVIESTKPAPIPPFVATGELGEDVLINLRSALVEVGSDSECTAERDILLLKGFAVPRQDDYDVLDTVLAASNRYPKLW